MNTTMDTLKQMSPALGDKLAGLVKEATLRAHHIPGLEHLRVTFTNGRGASVLTPTPGSTGGFYIGHATYEIAAFNTAGDIDYTTTAVGHDVLRTSDTEEAIQILAELAAMPPETRKELTR